MLDPHFRTLRRLIVFALLALAALWLPVLTSAGDVRLATVDIRDAATTSDPFAGALADPVHAASLTDSPFRVFLPLVRRSFEFANGDMESGFSGWTPDPASKLKVSISRDTAVSATHSLLLGDPGYSSCSRSVPVGFARVTRQVAVPDSLGTRISFWYRIVTQDTVNAKGTGAPLDSFEFAVNDGRPLLRDGEMDQAAGCEAVGFNSKADLGWRKYEASLDAYRGQTITLNFANYSREVDSNNQPDPTATLGFYNTYVYVDDVTIDVP